MGDSINAVYQLKEGVQFVDKVKLNTPLANFYRAENYFHKKDFKIQKFYKKVYKKVDRNDTNINWLYGDAYAATLSIDLIQNKTKGLNKKRVEKFYNESKSSNVAKQKKNALILRWLINVINNDIEISDSSLDELMIYTGLNLKPSLRMRQNILKI